MASSPPKTRRLRRVLVGLLATVALLLAAFAMLFTRAPLPLGAPRGFDLNLVRTIARAGDEPRPTTVGRWVVAKAHYPRGAVAAGWDYVTPITMVFPAFQIAWADRYIVIDAPHERATHDERFGGEDYDQAAYDGVAEALRGAERIVFTHEHLDHVRGVSRSPHFAELAPRLHLTQQQRDHMPDDAGFDAQQLDTVEGRALTEPTRLAPGVVLIPAPGHTPGSLYVYVALANGQEVLLVGDAVWSHHNLNRAAGRPLALSLWLHEDRAATLDQARSLIMLREAQRTLAVVPAHDDLTVQSYVRDGFLHDGFVEVSATP
ncbi:MAG: MBL fold metallo-hydrolase [Myxococcales bacterium]|nr:MBL fold metallo-hydrolase [Myxococcales bacterium]